MKYIVTKKCYANEFVSVVAESEEEALLKAMDNDCKSLGSYLEFGGYRDRDAWEIEELETTSNICNACGSRTDDVIKNKDKYNCKACSVEDDITGEH